jgi:hypothetical protein
MASVNIDLIPPSQAGLTKLLIYEAAEQGGPDTLIETVTEVGAYPNYITRYTTSVATSGVSWFSVDWEDAKGARIGRSARLQGGTFTLIGKIINRVIQRDLLVSEAVVAQEAEAVIQDYFATDNAYDTALTASGRILSGLTYLVLARTYIGQIITSAQSGGSYTAGLVSQKEASTAETRSRIDLLRDLVSEANRLLGLNTTVVMLIEDIDPLGLDIVSGVNWDHTRLVMTEYE